MHEIHRGNQVDSEKKLSKDLKSQFYGPGEKNRAEKGSILHNLTPSEVSNWNETCFTGSFISFAPALGHLDISFIKPYLADILVNFTLLKHSVQTFSNKSQNMKDFKSFYSHKNKQKGISVYRWAKSDS